MNREFLLKVKEMRTTQKKYYAEKKDRDVKAELLVKSKVLEREVDQMISSLESPTMFDGPINL